MNWKLGDKVTCSVVHNTGPCVIVEMRRDGKPIAEATDGDDMARIRIDGTEHHYIVAASTLRSAV